MHPRACSPSTSVLVYSRRKKSRETNLVVSEEGSPNVQEVGGPLSFEEDLPQARPQELDGAALPGFSDLGNVIEGSAWVLERIVFFCKKMGLAIEGREMELLSFLASLEANRMRREQSIEHSMGDEVDRVRLFSDGASINLIAWNVRGLNCPNKRGDVKWVLRSFASDVAILQESKL